MGKYKKVAIGIRIYYLLVPTISIFFIRMYSLVSYSPNEITYKLYISFLFILAWGILMLFLIQKKENFVTSYETRDRELWVIKEEVQESKYIKKKPRDKKLLIYEGVSNSIILLLFPVVSFFVPFASWAYMILWIIAVGLLYINTIIIMIWDKKTL